MVVVGAFSSEATEFPPSLLNPLPNLRSDHRQPFTRPTQLVAHPTHVLYGNALGCYRTRHDLEGPPNRRRWIDPGQGGACRRSYQTHTQAKEPSTSRRSAQAPASPEHPPPLPGKARQQQTPHSPLHDRPQLVRARPRRPTEQERWFVRSILLFIRGYLRHKAELLGSMTIGVSTTSSPSPTHDNSRRRDVTTGTGMWRSRSH